MQLVEGTFFRKYGDILYCRNTVKHRDYMFNAFAEDFLLYIKENQGCKFENLCAYLLKKYQVSSENDFINDMKEFSEELINAGILVGNEIQESEQLREKAISTARSAGRIFSAVLEITYRCNEKCIHCYVDDDVNQKKELTLDEYRDLLHSLAELGCVSVLITGGEPCLRTDLLQIVECAVQSGIFVDVYTNGLILDIDTVIRLAELKVNSVSFSLYGATPAVHDKITCVPGSFTRTIDSLLLCKAFGIDTYVKSVAMKQNYNDIENIFRLGKKLCVPIAITTMISSSHNGKSADEFRMLDDEKYRRVSAAILHNESLSEKELNELSFGREPSICRIGRNSICIDPFGTVFPCNALHYSLGNIRKQTLKEIYSNTTFFDAIDKLKFHDVCAKKDSCVDAGWCSFCLGNSFAENCSWNPTQEVCMVAKGSHLACLDLLKEVKENEGI